MQLLSIATIIGLLGYLGPGAGLSAVGALLAVVAAIVVALIGFVWYPMRRLMRACRGGKQPPYEAAMPKDAPEGAGSHARVNQIPLTSPDATAGSSAT